MPQFQKMDNYDSDVDLLNIDLDDGLSTDSALQYYLHNQSQSGNGPIYSGDNGIGNYINKINESVSGDNGVSHNGVGNKDGSFT